MKNPLKMPLMAVIVILFASCSQESEYDKTVRETNEQIKEMEENRKYKTDSINLHYDEAISKADSAAANN